MSSVFTKISIDQLLCQKVLCYDSLINYCISLYLTILAALTEVNDYVNYNQGITIIKHQHTKENNLCRRHMSNN